MSIWDSPVLEELRDSRRKRSGRIAYDCYNLVAEGNRAYCAEGHCLGQARTVTLLSVLKGVTPNACKSCLDYDGGE